MIAPICFVSVSFPDPEGKEVRAYLLRDRVWFYLHGRWTDHALKVLRTGEGDMALGAIFGECTVASKDDLRAVMDYIIELPRPAMLPKEWASEILGPNRAAELSRDERITMWFKSYFLQHASGAHPQAPSSRSS
jgi:hypothetical protein